MSRVPIRVRVTLAFAAVMALVLAAAGLFLHSQLGTRLSDSIDQGLRSRAAEVSALVRGSDGELDVSKGGAVIQGDESIAEVLTLSGRPVSADRSPGHLVLSAAELSRASRRPAFFERDHVRGIEGRVRLLGAPVERGRSRLIVVVGSSLDDRDDALRNLATLLLIGGPVALLIASLAGYGAATGALRPVEAMRRRAAAISARQPGERLPVAPARDEISRLGTTLNEMLERLQAALERERRFVDDASHELRTPLALHKTELELALRYAGGEAELRKAIASGVEEINRLIELAARLLAIASSEQDRGPIDLEPVSTRELLASVAERFRARAAEAGRRLEVDAAGDLVVAGDRLRLEQALISMVDNALRHGEGGVRLWARAAGDGVELHVGDEGPGFPDGFIDRAFERFSRAEAARPTGGGLGLAIVDAIAQAHGGRAGAANDPAGGADVWIEVPAAAS
jgi:signal transduction histidine kinase